MSEQESEPVDTFWTRWAKLKADPNRKPDQRYIADLKPEADIAQAEIEIAASYAAGGDGHTSTLLPVPVAGVCGHLAGFTATAVTRVDGGKDVPGVVTCLDCGAEFPGWRVAHNVSFD